MVLSFIFGLLSGPFNDLFGSLVTNTKRGSIAKSFLQIVGTMVELQKSFLKVFLWKFQNYSNSLRRSFRPQLIISDKMDIRNIKTLKIRPTPTSVRAWIDGGWFISYFDFWRVIYSKGWTPNFDDYVLQYFNLISTYCNSFALYPNSLDWYLLSH